MTTAKSSAAQRRKPPAASTETTSPTATKTRGPLIIDPLQEADRFAHRATKFLVDSGCITITFAALRASDGDETNRLVVTSRVTMPIGGALVLHQDLGRMLALYKAQGTTKPLGGANN